MLTFRFHDNLLDLGIGGFDQHLGTVEADASQDLANVNSNFTETSEGI